MGEEASSIDPREARVAFLAEQIAHHSHLYYNLAQPELSDAEFDRLWDELKQLDPNTHNSVALVQTLLRGA